MKYLDDFLIVEEGGIVVFSHSTDSGHIKDDALFAGLLEVYKNLTEYFINPHTFFIIMNRLKAHNSNR